MGIGPSRAAIGGLCAASLALAGCATRPPPSTLAPQSLAVPGYGDFLAVDGDAVWLTNQGRVERWTAQGLSRQVPIASPCGGMAIAKAALWVADCTHGAIARVDTRTGRIEAEVATGVANPDGELNVVAGGGSIWVPSDASGVISRIDPATNQVVATVRTDPGAWYLAYGLGALWAASSVAQSLERIDPATNRVVWRTSLGKAPGFLVAKEHAVWVQEQGDGTVARVDPKTGQVTARIKIGADLTYGDVDAGRGAVWLRTTAGQTFVVIGARSNQVLRRVGPAVGSGGLRFTPRGLWVTAHDRHVLFWYALAGHTQAKAPSSLAGRRIGDTAGSVTDGR